MNIPPIHIRFGKYADGDGGGFDSEVLLDQVHAFSIVRGLSFITKFDSITHIDSSLSPALSLHNLAPLHRHCGSYYSLGNLPNLVGGNGPNPLALRR